MKRGQVMAGGSGELPYGLVWRRERTRSSPAWWWTTSSVTWCQAN